VCQQSPATHSPTPPRLGLEDWNWDWTADKLLHFPQYNLLFELDTFLVLPSISIDTVQYIISSHLHFLCTYGEASRYSEGIAISFEHRLATGISDVRGRGWAGRRANDLQAPP
jgi:hypothetical protein